MITVDISGDLERIARQWADKAGRHLPYAAAKALTLTAKAGKEAVERALPQVLDRPTPFTMRGFKLQPATKARLVAKVEFRNAAARDYLAPLVFGGPRKVKAFERSLQGTGLVPSGWYAMPGSAAKRDAFGGMQRGQIAHVLAYLKAFKAGSGRANMTDKRIGAMAKASKRTGRRGVRYFIGQPGGGKGPLGVWERTDFGQAGSAVRPIIVFSRRPSYLRMLDVQGISTRVARERFAVELEAAVRDALATAR